MWNILFPSSLEHSWVESSLKGDTTEIEGLFLHIITYVIVCPGTTGRTPLENLDFVTAPETNQVHNFNNLPVNVIKAGKGEGILSTVFSQLLL